MPRGIYQRTNIYRHKMSNILKGRLFTKKWRKKLSDANRCRIHKKGYRNKQWIVKVCPVCKNVFEVLPCRQNKIFCSVQCSMIGRRKAVFSSRKGNKNSNWKGGITKLRC